MSHRPKVPSYRLHKQSGQAVVTLTDRLGNRRDVLLGKHNSPESKSEYERVIAEWLANGGRTAPTPATADLSVNELLVRSAPWAEQHYRALDGKPARELENVKEALKPLRRLYGHTAATAFGPLALRALQQELARSKLARSTLNNRINRVRRVFKWAASFQL